MFDPWVGKISWRKAWHPTPVFLPGESPWTEEPGELQSMGSQRVMTEQLSTHMKCLAWCLGADGKTLASVLTIHNPYTGWLEQQKHCLKVLEAGRLRSRCCQGLCLLKTVREGPPSLACRWPSFTCVSSYRLPFRKTMCLCLNLSFL